MERHALGLWVDIGAQDMEDGCEQCTSVGMRSVGWARGYQSVALRISIS
jgi:hypothetical protein